VLKHILLSLTFTAAFGAAGFCLSDNAEARRWRWGRPYVRYYYAPPAFYGYGVPYRTYYRGYYATPPYYHYYRLVPRVGVIVRPWWW
jgi:hypothetical protein